MLSLVVQSSPSWWCETKGMAPSTGGNIRAGKNVSNETKWGEKRLGCDLQSGVSAERNVDRLL